MPSEGGFFLELTEAPSLPQTPVIPRRVPLAAGGLAGGMALGISVVLLRRFQKPA